MKRTLYTFLLFLIASFHVASDMEATQKFSQEWFEQGAKACHTKSACLVRTYRASTLHLQSNGTYCELDGKRFILTTADMMQGDQWTVIFEDKIERRIKSFIRIDHTDHQGFKASLMAMGLLSDMPQDIEPTRIETKNTFLSSKECHVVGYGNSLNAHSSGQFVVFNADEDTFFNRMRPVVASFHMTPLRLSFNGEVAQADLQSTFRGHGVREASMFELPLPPGFSGAGIRNKDENIEGITLCTVPYWQTEAFHIQHPYAARTLYKLHEWVHTLQRPYLLTGTLLGLGTALTYMTYPYSAPLSLGLSLFTTASAYLSYKIQEIDEMLTHYTYLPGSETYGAQIYPWLPAIRQKLQQTSNRH